MCFLSVLFAAGVADFVAEEPSPGVTLMGTFPIQVFPRIIEARAFARSPSIPCAGSLLAKKEAPFWALQVPVSRRGRKEGREGEIPSKCGTTASSRRDEAVLVLPQVSKKFDIGLAPLAVLREKLASDGVLQLFTRAALLKLL
jgi:hypothetical protein